MSADAFNEIRILTRTSCPYCNGEGVVISPLWKQFHEDDQKYFEKNGKHMAMDDGVVDKYFSDKGYAHTYEKTKEEIDCPECKGNGSMHSSISIEELKRLLNDPTE